MLVVFKKLTKPYDFGEWHIHLINGVPQFIGGLFLTFYYAPRNIGVPWNTEFNNLSLFKVSPQFIGIVEDFGGIFSMYPVFFATAAAITMLFGGVLLMLGCCTRFASFFVFLVMLVTLVFREFDQSWSYIPTFAFLSLSILGIWFGSGKFSLDYLISKKFNWV